MTTQTIELADKMQVYALNELNNAAQQHRRAIAEVQRDLDHQRSGLDFGWMPSQPSSQRLTELSVSYAKLEAARVLAMVSGASHENINLAYSAGATDVSVWFQEEGK